jgi:hypothetical protein
MNKKISEMLEKLKQQTHVNFTFVLESILTGKREEKNISIPLEDFENNWNEAILPINAKYFVIKIIHSDTNTVLESYEKP